MYSTRMNDECWMTKFIKTEKKGKNPHKLTNLSRETERRTMIDENYHKWMDNRVAIRRDKDESQKRV